MSKLVIAEKPSVALSIAKVIGASKKQDGYYEGNGYVVSWCVGHLIKMSSPDVYDERYAKWKKEDLPIIPSEYLYEVEKNTKKQFGILKKLMNDKTVEAVVNACDAGREGELIFRLVYEQAKCKKPILRLWISSLEDKAIKDGFSGLKDGKKFENLYHSALARAKADWLVGMNLSRLYSTIHKQNYSVGRVQSPTLAMIVSRDEEIQGFKKEKYFTATLFLDGFSLSSGRIDDFEEAVKLLESVPEKIQISDVIEKEKITKPDKLYDLTTLQREANKLYGFSAKQTLDYAQSLYEQKLITYPRTDSRFLTEDMKSFVKELAMEIQEGFILCEKNYESLFDNKKVSDHYAIIPTRNSLTKNMAEIPESERKIYELVKVKLLMACSENLVENTTKIVSESGGYEFTANGKTVIREGFGVYRLKGNEAKKGSKDEDKEQILPTVSVGDEFVVNSKEVLEKFTKPPKAYTEDTLLKAMEVAGNESLDKGVEVERKGLGTPATRAGVIENLIYKGFVERDKKNLISTEKGRKLISVIDEVFKSAKLTAIWEMKLSFVASGNITEAEFLGDIEKEIKKIIESY